ISDLPMARGRTASGARPPRSPSSGGSGEDAAEGVPEPAEATHRRRRFVAARLTLGEDRGAPAEEPDRRAVGRGQEIVDEPADAGRAGDPDRHLEDLAA